MAGLRDYRTYLDGRRGVLAEVERRLCDLQSKYESHFAEVARVREEELTQLVEHTLADRARLPDWYGLEIEQHRGEVEAELDQRMAEIQAAAAAAAEQGEAERLASIEAEARVKTTNAALDREEETLKARTADLLERIEAFNGRITLMGRGFGFFANFFKMRRIAREKNALREEHDDLAARIEHLRVRWQREETEHAAAEQAHRQTWVEAETRAAALRTKLEALEQARPAMVARTTVERVLEGRRRELPEATDTSRSCPRCAAAVAGAQHFCHMCAQRLGEDRLDFAGSIDEIAEINGHFERFSAGMKGCQEIIGLVRGLLSGVDAFIESVADVQASEDKYPLPKLEIDVPEASLTFGTTFDQLRGLMDRDLSVHPREFAATMAELVEEVLTESAIQGWFEGLGDELSRQAERQWED